MKVLIAFSLGSDFDVTKKLWFRFTRSMGWCFALINGKLAEIFFDQKKNERIFFGHAYVKESDYKSKREKVWIEKDTKKCQFSYKKGIYIRVQMEQSTNVWICRKELH